MAAILAGSQRQRRRQRAVGQPGCMNGSGGG